MTPKLCCPKCFNDVGLSQDIIPSTSAEESVTATCSYCGAADAICFPPVQLQEAFTVLVEAYAEDEAGLPLSQLLRDDWQLFHPAMNDAQIKELLADVLDDGEIVRKNFITTSRDDGDSLRRWDVLRFELMHRNRWFPPEPIDEDNLARLLTFVIAPQELVEQSWYRARLLERDEPFPLSEMGAPPEHVAGHGRANPAGIPYLYLGSTAQTAIAEIRPHTGHKACVAVFQLPPGLRMVDLRAPRSQITPFLLEDAEEINQLRSDIPLLERLGDELTRPVLPNRAAYEYAPTQYLCEFIKKVGFDGVVYRSSVGEGINLALFKPIDAMGDVVVLTVEAVTVTVV